LELGEVPATVFFQPSGALEPLAMARTQKKRSAPKRVAPKEAVSQQKLESSALFSTVKEMGAAGQELAKAEELAKQLERALNEILNAHAAALEGWQIGALEHLRTVAASGIAQLRGHQTFLLTLVGARPEVSHG
jgi:uncharacterized protein YhaN